ncbi:MAG: His/Gly/Thr/Pro-type tRNA ligase C-terminal domain-containing protein, partial [Clostridioides difficile]|nr:His/Gly/Thr/Pro-type tRNA ligase C-terminal domain-containing protein [Clostridioides difficile]
HVVIVPANMKNEEQISIAENIYNDLQAMGVEVLLDDRDERIGVKFNDSELIGIPMRITVGKNINEGKVEFKLRHKEDKEIIDIEEINEKVKAEFIRNNVRLG